jgi:hypothetical protein
MPNSAPKAPAKPKRPWARLSKVWLSIDSLPTGSTAVLADETQTITWFAEKATKDPVKHSAHETDETGHPLFDLKGSQEHPRMAESVVEPAYWSPAAYVDEHGAPV